MNSLSFDGLVELYDETRSFDDRCFHSALGYIADSFPPPAFPTLFEPGIGTGRIAVPLARLGYRVMGVDISDDMLSVLRKRLELDASGLPIAHQRADITHLPFEDNTFDLAIAVHLFYFIKDWRRAVDEILRVVRRSGPVILLHTGMGSEIPFLNERYKELCASLDCPIPTVGVRSTQEVVDYACARGCGVEWIRDRWQWTSNIKLGPALDYIRGRAYSFTVFSPEAIHTQAANALEAEVKAKFGSLNTTMEVPNQISLAVLNRS